MVCISQVVIPAKAGIQGWEGRLTQGCLLIWDSLHAQEFAGRHSDRNLGVWDRIEGLMAGLFGKRLAYRQPLGRGDHKHPWQIERATFGESEYQFDKHRPFPSWSGVGKAMYERLRMQDGWEVAAYRLV